MSLLRRSVGSVFQATGRIAALITAFGAIGFAVNWIPLLGLTGLAFLDPLSLRAGGGVFSGGALAALFGVAFPLAWLLAAQPMAAMSAARHVYRRHKADVLAAITAALRVELEGDHEEDVTHWLGRFAELQLAIEAGMPAVLRPVVRLALRYSSLPDIERRVREGDGPVAVRLTEAVADQLEEQLSEGAATWLYVVLVINLLAFGAVLWLA